MYYIKLRSDYFRQQSPATRKPLDTPFPETRDSLPPGERLDRGQTTVPEAGQPIESRVLEKS